MTWMLDYDSIAEQIVEWLRNDGVSDSTLATLAAVLETAWDDGLNPEFLTKRLRIETLGYELLNPRQED